MLNEPFNKNNEQFQPTVEEALKMAIDDLIDVDPTLTVCDIPIYEIWNSKDVQGFLNEFGANPIDLSSTTYFGKNQVIMDLAFAGLELLPDSEAKRYLSYIKANCISIEEQEGRHDLDPDSQYYQTNASYRPDLDPNVLTLAGMVYTWMQKMTDKPFEFFQNKFMAEYTPDQVNLVIDFIAAKELGLALDSFKFAKEAKELIEKGEMAPDDFIKRHQRRYQVQEFQKILNYIFGEQ